MEEPQFKTIKSIVIKKENYNSVFLTEWSLNNNFKEKTGHFIWLQRINT